MLIVVLSVISRCAIKLIDLEGLRDKKTHYLPNNDKYFNINGERLKKTKKAPTFHVLD